LKQMVLMGTDIAVGMKYLGDHGVVHRDLAARNCMVGERYKVKVGDFGLTRKVYSSEYYRMKHSAPLPIRWMAFECLMDGVFTSASDLWSFGIVLWEIFSLGKMPYDEYDNKEVVEQVCECDYRMAAPKLSPVGLHTMMLQCWEEEPEDRGTFADRTAELTAMASKLTDDPISREMYKGRVAANTSPTAADLADDAEDTEVRQAYDSPDRSASQESGYEEPVVGLGYGLLKKVTVQLGQAAVNNSSVAAWIASTTGRAVESSDLHTALRDGQTLCALMNKLKPASIRKIYTGRNAVKQMENINKFVTSATEEFGIEMFEVDDLFEDLDMLRVMACIAELRGTTERCISGTTT